MAASITVNLGELPVAVRALTAREIYEWQVEIEAKQAGQLPCNPAYDLFFDDCGLDDLARMTDADADDLAEFTADELGPVIDAARELNRPFFRVRAALAEATMAHQALAMLEARERQREQSWPS